MTCHHVRIPQDAKLAGCTADGQLTTVLPGEYVVHELPSKTSNPTLFRFVGADVVGRDVHVPLEAFRGYLDIAAFA